MILITMAKYQTIKWHQWICQHIISYTWTFDILEPIKLWPEQVISSELGNDKSAYHKNKNKVSWIRGYHIGWYIVHSDTISKENLYQGSYYKLYWWVYLYKPIQMAYPKSIYLFIRCYAFSHFILLVDITSFNVSGNISSPI